MKRKRQASTLYRVIAIADDSVLETVDGMSEIEAIAYALIEHGSQGYGYIIQRYDASDRSWHEIAFVPVS